MPRARTSLTLLAVALVAAAGAYALGSRRAATEATSVSQRAAIEATTAPQRAAATPTRAAPAGLDEAAFWRLIADTRTAAGNDTGRESDLLDARLRKLPAPQIASFERIRHTLDRRAYTWHLWGAAYVIED